MIYRFNGFAIKKPLACQFTSYTYLLTIFYKKHERLIETLINPDKMYSEFIENLKKINPS